MLSAKADFLLCNTRFFYKEHKDLDAEKRSKIKNS